MMPREPRKELGAAQVGALWRRGTNHVGGVRGLILNVTMYGSRSWVLRYQVAGKRRDLGLGYIRLSRWPMHGRRLGLPVPNWHKVSTLSKMRAERGPVWSRKSTPA